MSELQTFSVWVAAKQAHFISVYEPIKPMNVDGPAKAGLSFDADCIPATLYNEVPGLLMVHQARQEHVHKFKREDEGPMTLRANASALVQVQPMLRGGSRREALDRLIWERQALAALNTRPDFLFYDRNLVLDLSCYQYDTPYKKGWALALRGVTVDLTEECPALRSFY
jgi:hypothetical protein